MQLSISRNAIGGVLLLVMGFAIGSYSLTNYEVGGMSGMGPGMLPLILSGILMISGAVCLFLKDEPDDEPLNAGAFFLIIGSILAFAAAIETFGLFPAVAILVAIASLAHGDRSLRRAIILTVFLSITAAAIFVYGVGLPLKLVG